MRLLILLSPNNDVFVLIDMVITRFTYKMYMHFICILITTIHVKLMSNNLIVWTMSYKCRSYTIPGTIKR